MVERPRRPFERPLRTVEHVAAIIGAKVPFHVYVERVRCERTFRIIQTDMFCDDLEFCFIFNHSELRNVKFPIPHHLGGTVFKDTIRRIFHPNQLTRQYGEAITASLYDCFFSCFWAHPRLVDMIFFE